MSTVDNPLLELLESFTGSPDVFTIRQDAVTKYAWAVPDRHAVEFLAGLGPLVEIGAGGGYWAHLVTQAGGDIVAFDTHTAGTQNLFASRSWFPVRLGGPEAAAEHPDRALLLCWPPYGTDFAASCVEHYQGSTVVYIGEGEGGCTADDTFHQRLAELFVLTATFDIPTWPGLHDKMWVYRRR